MALQIDRYQLRKGDTELAIFFPYPWGGERHNNEQLLKEISLLTGGLVLGAQTPGTGRMYIDRATRKRLRPGPFAELAADYAGEVHEFLEASGQPVRLLAAQSGRVALGARMQLSEHRPFTHALLRDGVNLLAPERVRDGVRRLQAQPSEGEHGTMAEEHKSTTHKLRDTRARWHGRAEILNHAELMCSTESRAAVETLARDIMTPLYHITFANGITGTPGQQGRFNTLLVAMRAARGQGFMAPMEAATVPGNHADLQNPLLFHDHILYTLSLGDPRHDPPAGPPQVVPL
jgi:hypothetical protein